MTPVDIGQSKIVVAGQALIRAFAVTHLQRRQRGIGIYLVVALIFIWGNISNEAGPKAGGQIGSDGVVRQAPGKISH